MRPIDGDALMKIVDYEIERAEEEMRDAEKRPNLYTDDFRKHKSYTVAGMAHIAQDILEAPTIDAVPVVRCKDCVYGTDRTDDFQEENERWDVVNPIACMMYSSDRIPDFFPKDNYCGFGKMRDDEESRDDDKSCDTCKYYDKGWDDIVCDGCTKAHSNWERRDDE